MADDDKSQIIVAPNMLRAKVGDKPGPDIDQLVASATAALDELKQDFEIWIRDDLKSLRDSVAAMHVATDPAALEHIKRYAHEIKGQGSTYGYPLLTDAGDLLYRFISTDTEIAAQNLNLIDVHVDFMALVLNQEIHDHGDALAQGVLTGLRNAAKKALGAAAAPASPTRSTG